MRVDVLCHCNESDAERHQFLDALDRVGDAPAPSVQLPNAYRIESSLARIGYEPVQLRPARLRAAPAGINILSVHSPLTRGGVVPKLPELHLAVLIGRAYSGVQCDLHPR